ncbi:MAG: type IV toxin-antitoxin system AbiEi family antitoxin domain-containing protein [Rhodopirellula sp.]|nr:type IV toxin-antitoxin system AbiEi family antitoxin domain-containing protein [Rhodopirellula sp.]
MRQQFGRDVFDYQQLTACLSHLRKPRDRIHKLLAKGDIVRIRKGLYTFGRMYRRESLSLEVLANLIHGPSYISLDYALSCHGLIPERVSTVTSVALGRSRQFDTPLGTFTYQSLSLPRYALGADLVESSAGCFLIACAEKALADKVWTDKRFSGASRSDFRPYLEEDLRIDPADLARLDRSRFQIIQQAYRSKKIGNLFRFLASLGEPSHA